MAVPTIIAGAGDRPMLRFIDFFTACTRNSNTRAAYGVAVRGFFAWLEINGLTELHAIGTHHVSAYIEMLRRSYSAPTVKQHLAAIRRLFDWLIAGQIIDQNPAAPVRGPRYIVKKGKTLVLDGNEVRKLIDSIDVSTIIGLRDRALIALLIYTFARISAALQMNVEDYYPRGKCWRVRLHEKGGKRHEIPAHHLLEQYLDSYVRGAGIGTKKGTPLFHTFAGRGHKHVSGKRMTPGDAHHVIAHRARRAGIFARVGCHSLRATGITIYLLNGGFLNHAQAMAAHQSPHTTRLYGRGNVQITHDEVDRIVL
jgi:site-specific recombinase XerD